LGGRFSYFRSEERRGHRVEFASYLGSGATYMLGRA
jgi:hypothetical protein